LTVLASYLTSNHLAFPPLKWSSDERKSSYVFQSLCKEFEEQRQSSKMLNSSSLSQPEAALWKVCSVHNG
jgi:hypothetical protein